MRCLTDYNYRQKIPLTLKTWPLILSRIVIFWTALQRPKQHYLKLYSPNVLKWSQGSYQTKPEVSLALSHSFPILPSFLDIHFQRLLLHGLINITFQTTLQELFKFYQYLIIISWILTLDPKLCKGNRILRIFFSYVAMSFISDTFILDSL